MDHTDIQPTTPPSDGQERLARPQKRKQVETQANKFDRNLALIVGINAYRNDIPQLKTAVNDAQALKTVLEEKHDYEVTLLTDGEATREGLVSLLDKKEPDSWASQIGPNDRVLFYFAGHGIADEGEDGPAGFILPQDADPEQAETTFLEMPHLHDLLTDLDCRHMFIILDCCFAGAMRWSTMRAVQKPPQTIHRQRYEHYINSPAWQLLTSAAYDQTALDVLRGKVYSTGRPSTGNHSPFAQALLDALSGDVADTYPPAKDGQPAGDGLLTAYELYQHIEDTVWQDAGQVKHLQTPELWPLKKHRNGLYIFHVPGRPLDLPEAEELTLKLNPYRGLQSFEAKHHEFFFGRQRVIRALLERVSASALTVVLGASGTGKSSVVKAGLLPVLQGKAKLDPEAEADENTPAVEPDTWHVLPPIRPGQHPIQELERLLTDELKITTPHLHENHPHALAKHLTAWATANKNKKLLLTLDQFEEMITACHDEDERKQFLELLADALRTQPDRFRLILTLRTDFEPQLADLGLKRYWEKARFIVPPLSQGELREVIEGPASLRVLYFEPPELVERLVEEVNQTPGALPLLSFALSEMYINYVHRNSDTRAITQDDYAALGGDETLGGGVIGALRNRANKEYDQLTKDFPTDGQAYQDTMRRVMLRMVAVEGGELARRRVPLSELEYTDPTERQRVDTIIERLTEARLLVGGSITDTNDQEQPYVEPAHDALVRAWDKLIKWSQESAEDLPLQRRLNQAAVDWANEPDEQAQRNRLWHNNPNLPRLEQIVTDQTISDDQSLLARWWQQFINLWRSQTLVPVEGHWLNQVELKFVQESVLRRQRDARRLVMTVTGVIVALAALAIFAFIQQGLATENAAEAQRQQGTAEAESTRANEQAEEAQRQQGIAEDNEAEAQKQQGIAEENAAEAEQEARISRAGQLAAQSQAATSSAQQLLLALESLRVLEPGDPYQAAPEQALREALQKPLGRPLSGHTNSISLVAFSPEGNWLATGSNDGTARLWSVGNPDAEPVILPGHDSSVTSLAFSPDEAWLATGSSKNITRLWSIKNPTDDPIILPGPDDSTDSEVPFITSLAFNPEGNWLATGSSDGSVWLWSVDQLIPEPKILEGHDERINTLAFSPDGTWLATGSSDETVKLWSVQDLAIEPQYILDYDDSVRALAFSPESDWLAVGSSYGEIQLWSIGQLTGEPRTLQSRTTGINIIDAVAFSSDGAWLATAYNNEVRVWSVDEPIIEPKILSHSDSVNTLAFSPDGTWLATGSSDGTARLWSVEDPIGEQPVLLQGHQDSLTTLAFSPDGTWLATGSLDSMAMLWPVEALTVEPVVLDDQPDYISSVAFSPDGTQLAEGGGDDTVRVWSVADLTEEPMILPGHSFGLDGGESALAFSPDGNWLATKDDDRVVRLWPIKEMIVEPVATLQLPGETETAYASTLAFSPDGNWLAMGTQDYTVWLQSIKELTLRSELTTPPIILEGHTAAISTLAFSPDGNWLATGSWDPPILLWSMDEPTTDPQELPFISNDLFYNLTFSPNSDWVAATSSTLVYLWSVADPASNWRVLRSGRTLSDSNLLAFSPDGTRLALGDDEGNVWLWPIQQPNPEPQVLRGHTDSIWTLAFSPDGTWLATTSVDMTVRLWSVITPTANSVVLHGHQDSVDTLAFSPDGSWLATGSDDSTVRLWRMNQDELKEMACAFAGRNLTFAEWRQYFDDSKETAWQTCPKHWPVHPTIPDGLYFEGGTLAQATQVEEAMTKFEKVRTFDPERVQDPEALAKSIAAETLWLNGEELARAGQLENAIDIFKQVKDYDPDWEIDPEAEAGMFWVRTLEQRAEGLARDGQVEEAIELLQEAKHFDPTLEIDPEEVAHNLDQARVLIEGVVEQVEAGQVEEAMFAIERAQQLDQYVRISREIKNEVCWFGSLWNQAELVEAICEEATGDPIQGYRFIDSRGLNRVLLGKYDEAIKDFREFVNAYDNWPHLFEDDINKRRVWIEALERGENPFTPQVLEELRNKASQDVGP